MKISWCLASPIEGLVDEARLCEAVGLDGVWYPDYRAPFSETAALYVALTAVAASTRRLYIGSMVTDVLRRYPMVRAHAFSSLNRLAPGRVVLGVGAGAGTSVRQPVSKLQEGINVIKMLWGATPKKPAYFKGRYFTLEEAGVPLKPSSKIPVYVASYGHKMLELTAKVADGWIPESHTPATYRKTLERIQALMKDFGRDLKDFEPCLAAIYYPFGPDDKAYNRILSAAKHYLACYPDIQWAAEQGAEHPGLRTQQLMLEPQLWDELASKVPDTLADPTIIYGNVEECIDRIASFMEAGCHHIALEPYRIEKDRINDAIKTAGDKIRPRIA
ncbi:MAG: LLM class flavin-dependent oxidoreductase [Candidatus Caldarchaeum sp.]